MLEKGGGGEVEIRKEAARLEELSESLWIQKVHPGGPRGQ